MHFSRPMPAGATYKTAPRTLFLWRKDCDTLSTQSFLECRAGWQEVNRRRQLIDRKPFLGRLYSEWYRLVSAQLEGVSGPVLEIGSGPGSMQEHVENLIRSDIVWHEEQHAVLDATAIPFRARSLAGIVGVNVFHHLPSPHLFFREVQRCLQLGGRLVLVEPWVTAWSSFLFQRLHHEGFDPKAAWQSVEAGAPLSSANNALAWIVFGRDKEQFTERYPDLRLEKAAPMMPFVYLLSGGVSHRASLPSFAYPGIRLIERALSVLLPYIAVFALIVVTHNADRDIRLG